MMTMLLPYAPNISVVNPKNIEPLIDDRLDDAHGLFNTL